MCSDVTSPRYRPFCSRHCADSDLINWLGGRYRIPVIDQDTVDDAPLDDGQSEDD
jgi:endogenous inhibitor of DNA gyrase (YacG/DUF329 family)